jgi:uncharacterized cupin superfamily protein
LWISSPTWTLPPGHRDCPWTPRGAETVEEAGLEELASGLAPATDGWFVVNVRDTAWVTSALGAACFFEGFFEDADAPFTELGINLRALWPGRSKWLYHAEDDQEDFLMLAGECLLLIEGEERSLHAWDFAHCPPGTEHAFVATGEGPCVILMVGARPPGWPRRGILYPRSELALRHGVGVETETTSPAEAGAPEWQLGRPDDWSELPWGKVPAQ